MTAVLPVFVVEDVDVTIFDDLAAAAEYVEAVDVRDDRYRFYDAEGTELVATVHEVPPRGVFARVLRVGPQEKVTLEVSRPARRASTELTSAIKRFLRALGEQTTGMTDEQIDVAGLETLVRAVSKHAHA